MTTNSYFIAGTEFLLDATDAEKAKEVKQNSEKLEQRIKNLLQLKNVNFLVGNGASLHLGAPKISSIKSYFEKEIRSEWVEALKGTEKTQFEKLKGFIVDKNITIDIEYFLNLLIQATSVVGSKSIFELPLIPGVSYTLEEAQMWINLIKKSLWDSCTTFCKKLNSSDLINHKLLIQKILLRQANLPRIKLFTINYDLVLERTMDELGVAYFDGFIGGYEKHFSPESYQYDLYYPGDITEGRVNRVDRVLQLYKLHGSVHWVKQKENEANFLGIKQTFDIDKIADLLIYPSTVKYGETLGFPYSEMFRHFSSSLFRPQSVLFTLGYSFKDEHINKLILQAFAIPTFNLVAVIPEGKDNPLIKELIEKVGSNRVIVISGMQLDEERAAIKSGAGTFEYFVRQVLPDIEELKIREKMEKELVGISNILMGASLPEPEEGSVE